jgi:hypothetical protein
VTSLNMFPDGNQFVPAPPIGFIGAARSGKDEAARVLIDNGYTPMSYGDVIKKFFEKFVREQLDLDVFTQNTQEKARFRSLLEHGGELLKVSIPHFLTAANTFNTECDPNVEWDTEDAADLVSSATRPLLVQYEEQMLESLIAGNRIVNSRVMSEAHIFKKLGGKIYEIVRPGVNPVSDWEASFIAGMKRENLITGQIKNTGGLYELYSATRRAVGLPDGLQPVSGTQTPIQA